MGWLIFTKALGIGDDDAFDLGGLLGAIILLLLYRQFKPKDKDADKAHPGRSG